MVLAGEGRRLLLSCIAAAATVLRQLSVPAQLLLFPVTAAAVAAATAAPVFAQRHGVFGVVHLSFVGVATCAASPAIRCAAARPDAGLVQPQLSLTSNASLLGEVAVVVVLHETLAWAGTPAASNVTRCAGGRAVAQLMQAQRPIATHHVPRAIAVLILPGTGSPYDVAVPLSWCVGMTAAVGLMQLLRRAQSPGPLHATALVMATLLAVARATLPATARRVFRCVVLLQSDGVTHMSMNNTCVIALRVCVCVCVFDSAHAKRG